MFGRAVINSMIDEVSEKIFSVLWLEKIISYRSYSKLQKTSRISYEHMHMNDRLCSFYLFQFCSYDVVQIILLKIKFYVIFKIFHSQMISGNPIRSGQDISSIFFCSNGDLKIVVRHLRTRHLRTMPYNSGLDEASKIILNFAVFLPFYASLERGWTWDESIS
jgi:hypothetical protein